MGWSVGPRENEQARWQEEAGGVLLCTRSLVPVKMVPKPVKWAFCPPRNVLVAPCGLTLVVGALVGMGAELRSLRLPSAAVVPPYGSARRP